MTDVDTLSNALEDGLAALEAGQPLAAVQVELAARHPEQAGELGALLAAAQAAGAGQSLAAVPRPAQLASRASFLARAGALRRPAQPRRGGLGRFLAPALARGLAVLFVFLAGFAAGTYGAVTASADALPGDPLYALKRAVERTELLLANHPAARARLEADFAQRRIDEAQTVAAQGRETRVAFTGWLSALDGERWTVSGLPVIVPAGTPVTGEPAPGTWVHVAGAVRVDGSILAERVGVLSNADVPLPTATPAPSTAPLTTAVPGAGEDVEFTGVVQAIAPTAWQIGGQTVRVSAATEVRDNPLVGQVVDVHAERQADGSLLATRIELEDDDIDDDDDGGGGSSPSNTPDPSDDDDDGDGGSSTPHTPEPDDDDDGNSGSGGPGDD